MKKVGEGERKEEIKNRSRGEATGEKITPLLGKNYPADKTG